MDRREINQQLADRAGAMDHVECWQCHGDGRIAGCFEDTCCCTGDPDDPDYCCAPSRCDVCGGKGSYPMTSADPGDYTV